jgi:tetratricopeptide (TPR) repeat protein
MNLREADKGKTRITRILAAAVLLLTFIVMVPTLDNGMTNWDDIDYILVNSDVQTFDLKGIFTENVLGNYHPLTMLTFAMEWNWIGTTPKVFHGTNLILHLLNTLLVFWLIFLLSGRMIVATITAVFFGIHPMHVESIAWVSERKDLLYTVFFVGGLITYYKFLVKGRAILYAATIGLFILALLSKPAAIVFPFVLILIDYWVERKSDKGTLLDKLPFFALAIAFGLTALQFQQSAGAVVDIPVMDRIFYAFYGLMMYIVKFIAPLNLSAIYPFPESVSNVHYLALFFVLVLGITTYFSFKKGRLIPFALGFYLVNLILVLQLIPFGEAVIADRYTYVPYIGLAFLVAMSFDRIQSLRGGPLASLKVPFTLALVAYVAVFSFASRERIKVWYNSEKLWEDVIAKYPNFTNAYISKATFYYVGREYEKAIKELDKAIALEPDNAEALNNRGGIYYVLGDGDNALPDFQAAIKSKPNYPNAYLNRGSLYAEQGLPQYALGDFDKAVSLQPDYWEAYFKRGMVLYELKQYGDAMMDMNKVIFLNKIHYQSLELRGDIFMTQGDNHSSQQSYVEATAAWENAIKDYDQAFELAGTQGANIAYKVGHGYFKLQNYELAVNHFTTAISMAPEAAAAYNGRANAYWQLKAFQRAWNDLQKAKELGFEISAGFEESLKKQLGN